MTGYHLSSPCLSKSELEVSNVSNLPIDVLKEEVPQVIRQRFPDTADLQKGNDVVHKSFGCLPDFGEIVQICILHECILFAVKELICWYREHYRAFELSTAPTVEMT